MIFALVGLTLLNVFQFVFWGMQNQILINKLMSRSFAEYDLVKNKPEPQEVVGFKEYEESFEEEEILNELNGLLPKDGSTR